MSINLNENHKDPHTTTTQARCNAPELFISSLKPLAYRYFNCPEGRAHSVAQRGHVPRPMTPNQFLNLLQRHTDPQSVTSRFPMRRVRLRQMSGIGPPPLSLRLLASSGSEAYTVKTIIAFNSWRPPTLSAHPATT
ncbi:hypothetical protein K443DRAFT_593313 [Laccaria amethystina LaAM-08-1]|uniref:Unplaced genomic scaffold K443scaffold_82, whole genome shotgun sequence n=1 Tax=Laccaria amethystina LaAM-08-1 TaxID=1095629 RepID=A0A0C9XSV3_9AGAR|nr:hypothetical protein K443DRAFT_593313 [Laccaria amethystina LaAM-08-1]